MDSTGYIWGYMYVYTNTDTHEVTIDDKEGPEFEGV